jgi:hypothetical protein
VDNEVVKEEVSSVTEYLVVDAEEVASSICLRHAERHYVGHIEHVEAW